MMDFYDDDENKIYLMKPIKPSKKYKWYWNVLWGIGWLITVGVILLCFYGLFTFGGWIYELN